MTINHSNASVLLNIFCIPVKRGGVIHVNIKVLY